MRLNLNGFQPCRQEATRKSFKESLFSLRGFWPIAYYSPTQKRFINTPLTLTIFCKQTMNQSNSEICQSSDPTQEFPIDPLEMVEPPSLSPSPKMSPNCNPATRFPYRHYQTLHPCSNKILALKWDQTRRKQHLAKLSKVKSSLDNQQNQKFLLNKLKKIQLEKGGYK
jgi:hypothetical protein